MAHLYFQHSKLNYGWGFGLTLLFERIAMKKWIYELIVAAVLLIVGLGVWWFVSTKDDRAYKAETEKLIRYAQRQALEIAIIENASKLTNYKQQIATARKPKPIIPEFVGPNPPKFFGDPNANR